MKKSLNSIKIFVLLILILNLFTACAPASESSIPTKTSNIVESADKITEQSFPLTIDAETSESFSTNKTPSEPARDYSDITFNGKYNLIEVDGGDRNGIREPLVVVDIGFGDREYWAYTNEYGQLVRVVAKQIILQDDNNEPVNENGRYYNDGADVPGTERKDMDKGHVIADSLGGVSNAYNITPQNSILNRHGNQAYMEKVIRDAGGCSDFEAIITYPDTKTQIPSHYHYTYTINGNVITEDFDNVNPDEANKSLYDKPTSVPEQTSKQSDTKENHDISSIDTNGNGHISIAEAKAAGYKMPITKDHWLYQYMTDADGDGMVGE